MKRKLIPILLLFLILFLISLIIKPVSAPGDMDVTLTVSPSSVTVQGVGNCQSVTGTISNDNWLCEIHCNWQTSQGYSGSVNNIPAGSSSSFNTNVCAQGSSPTSVSITTYCDAPGIFCGFSGSDSDSVLIYFNYCGDGTCNGNEDCSSCSIDCGCYGQQICVPSRQGSNSKGCYTIQCGDGYKDSGETSQTCCQDAGCPSNKQCVNNACKTDEGGYCSSAYECVGNYCVHSKCSSQPYLANDGYCDSSVGENCGNSPSDCGCSSGYCKTDTGQCVECLTDSHCDNTPIYSSGGSSYCSSDNKKAIQTGTRSFEVCGYSNNCVQTTVNEDEEINCGNNLCQDGHCGCNNGYKACLESNRCLKIGVLNINDGCYCDFQCETGLCRQGKCSEGLIADLSSEKTVIAPTEETVVSFGVKNPFNQKITATLIIRLGSGVGTSAVISGQDCSGSQCTSTIELTENDREEISVTLNANNIGNVPLVSTLTYNLDGQPIEVNKEIEIKVTECGEEDCTSSTQKWLDYLIKNKVDIGNYKISILALIGIILGLLIVVFGIVSISKKSKTSIKTDKKKKRPKEKSNKIKKDYKNKSVSKTKKHSFKEKILNVCSECKEVLHKGSKYCHKCGGKAKKVKV